MKTARHPEALPRDPLCLVGRPPVWAEEIPHCVRDDAKCHCERPLGVWQSPLLRRRSPAPPPYFAATGAGASAFTGAFAPASSNHSMSTDFGRSMASPIARLQMSWARMPMARDTPNSTV